MNPTVSISWGELIDRVTILEIKAARLSDDAARARVARELAALSEMAGSAVAREPRVLALKSALREVNETLWSIEDEIRQKEVRQQFDAEFIRLARAIYQNNDERGRLKREINLLLQSDLGEEKQYTKY
ncbi:MAG: hypothetical protein KGO48_17365 [Alphaproteobacteria bacterium]|nr:hypothetical protein [Alphaproteobacteria bacterium]